MNKNQHREHEAEIKSEFLISKRIGSLFKSHALFFISLGVFIAYWYNYYEMIFTISFIWFPYLAIIYLILLFLLPVRGLRPIQKVAWAFPAAGLIIILTAQIAIYFATETIVYRLGMDVQTPTGIVSGSSMIEVYNARNPITMLRKVNRGETKVKGEAVLLNFSEGKNLVAILAFKKEEQGTYTLAEIAIKANKEQLESIQSKPRRQKLPSDLTPILITFLNINNPNTMELVNPDHLSEIFGPGYSIHNIWVEITDEPYISSNIQNYIKWINTTIDRRRVYVKPLKSLGIYSAYAPFERTR